MWYFIWFLQVFISQNLSKLKQTGTSSIIIIICLVVRIYFNWYTSTKCYCIVWQTHLTTDSRHFWKQFQTTGLESNPSLIVWENRPTSLVSFQSEATLKLYFLNDTISLFSNGLHFSNYPMQNSYSASFLARCSFVRHMQMYLCVSVWENVYLLIRLSHKHTYTHTLICTS